MQYKLNVLTYLFVENKVGNQDFNDIENIQDQMVEDFVREKIDRKFWDKLALNFKY